MKKKPATRLPQRDAELAPALGRNPRGTGEPMSLMTEKEAAEFCKVSRATIRRLIKAGRLKAVSLGTGKRPLYRIDPASLLEIAAEPKPIVIPRARRRRAVTPPGDTSWLPDADDRSWTPPRL